MQVNRDLLYDNGDTQHYHRIGILRWGRPGPLPHGQSNTLHWKIVWE